MRIQRVRIQNFRCLEDVDVSFDYVTTFVGPNGVGKSTILRALDWFFNGTKSSVLTVDDVYLRDATRTVSVEVQFGDLTEADREALGKYAPTGQDTVTVWKIWEDGHEKMTGRGRAFPPFEVVRSGANATERKQLYIELRDARPELALPAWTTDANGISAMSEWEARNAALLEEVKIDSGTHFFGFAGQALMSGLFDYVFVSADMRAAEESQDSRTALLGRILERTVNRSGADADLASLLAEVAESQAAIHDRHFGSQLADLSDKLSEAVGTLASGRTIRVAAEPVAVPPQRAQFRVSVIDETIETRVERQGHGFQRALIIAALKLLAEHGQGEGEHGVLCLAIEEPELYQHPLQARSFAAVLRSLAEAGGIQVAYATHSPYFIEARAFAQVRRVTRLPREDGQGAVQVVGSTVDRVVRALDGTIEREKVLKQLDSVCLGSLSEAFFADSVLLVEGSTDRAVLSGVAAKQAIPFLQDGIYIGEAGGKGGLLLPYVILRELGIRATMVADNDSHLLERLTDAESSGNRERVKQLHDSIENEKSWNRKLLRFFGLEEVDFPSSAVCEYLTFVDGGLEAALQRMWPEWAATRDELISEGVGFSGKDSATYEEAVLRTSGPVPAEISSLLENVRQLRIAA